METFYQTVCNGVVGGCPNLFGSEQPYHLLPKIGLELPSSISCDDRRNSKSRNPAGDKCIRNFLSRDICYGNCSWLACEMVHTCQQSMRNHLKVVMVPQYPDEYDQIEHQVENGVTVCRCIFDLWHYRHDRAHFLTLEFMFGHTNHAVTRCCIARIPACDSEWSESNTGRLKLGGT